MVELTPTPGLNDELLPGDEIWLLYHLMQGGEWFVNWQIGKLETKFDEDGRFILKSYEYDPEGFRLRLKIIVRNEPLTPTQRAGSAESIILGALLGVVATVLYGMIMGEATTEKHLRNIDLINANANLTPEQKTQAINAEVQEIGKPSDLSSMAGALMFVGVAILALVLLGVKR